MAFYSWLLSPPFGSFLLLRAFSRSTLRKTAQQIGIPSWSYNTETWGVAPASMVVSYEGVKARRLLSLERTVRPGMRASEK